MEILEQVIEQNDKPRAEIVVDVEILEVDRERAKTYGLNLSEFALGAVFSPEVSPSGSDVDQRRRPGHRDRHDRRRHDDDDAGTRRRRAASGRRRRST